MFDIKVLGFTIANHCFQRLNLKLLSDYVRNLQHYINEVKTLPGYTLANEVEVFINSSDYFNDLLNSISTAKKRVWIESFIMDASNVAHILAKYLIDAKKRGVEVKVCVDGLGKYYSNRAFFKLLVDNNIAVRFWNPCFKNRVGPLFYRNHRKLVLCDDSAYVSSANFDKRSIKLPKEAL